MYPRLSDMIFDLTGLYLPLPIQTFGFFMALAFLMGAFVVYREFLRLEKTGVLHGIKETHTIGHAPSPFSVLTNAVLGFVLGYKGVHMLLNWTTFVDNPQTFLVSGDGSIIGAILGAIVMGGYYYWEQKKAQLPKPQQVETLVYPHDRVGDIIIIAAIAGILGSKLFTWIEDWDAFLADPVGALLSFSGLTFYGGMICASLALAYYARIKQIPLLRLMDVGALALIIAHAIGRLGCHFSGDGDWGIPNLAAKPFEWLPDWLWAYQYPNNVINSGVLIPGCEGRHCHILPEGVYPTSVYEFFLMSGIFILLVLIRKRLKVAGLMFVLYLIIIGLERFLIEFIRVNPDYHWFGIPLSQAQLISVGFVISGLIIGAILIVRHNRKTASLR